ncbi:MAG: hypothetical protein WB766_07385 [Roseiarcus sp.]
MAQVVSLKMFREPPSLREGLGMSLIVIAAGILSSGLRRDAAEARTPHPPRITQMLNVEIPKPAKKIKTAETKFFRRRQSRACSKFSKHAL